METQLSTVSRSRSPEFPGLLTAPGRETFGVEGDSDTNAEIIALAFKAISHPVRVSILDLLSRQAKPMCVCHIESRFTLSQPTISHHLRLLRKAGLVSSQRRGTWIYYSVRKEGVEPLKLFVTSILCELGETDRVNSIWGIAEA